MSIKAENDITLVRVDDGEEGADGTTFYPSVSSEGVISWTNDGEKPNPEPVVIKGPQGISLNSVTRYYKLSDTTPTDYPPSTGWQTSEPAYTPGDARNLYICDLFAWSNSTVTHSEVSLSSSYEAAKQAFDAAQGAMTAANGKNKVYHQTSQPTGGVYKTGDIWFDTDGGNKIYIYNETNGTWEASLIGNDAIVASGIDAGKITVGTLNANRIAANSLTIGKIATADQAQILNSNVQVGGRNLFANSDKLDTKWTLQNGTVEEGIVTLNGTATGDTRIYQLPADGYWVWTANTEYVVSIDAKASSDGAVLKFTATGGSGKTKNVALTTEWKRYTFEFKTTTSVSTSSMSFYRRDVGASIDLRQPKLELGNKATDWTPAPEDVDSDISSKASVIDLEEVQTSAEQKVAIGDSNIEDITDVMQFADGTIKVGNDANATEITRTGIVIRNETYEVFVSADELKTANSRLSTIKLRNAQNNSGNLAWVAESDGSVSLKVVSD